MKKLIAAITMLVVAGTLAFFLKDYIDSENPQYAVAQIQITADTMTVPHMLAGYEWSFYNGRVSTMQEIPWNEADEILKPGVVTNESGEEVSILGGEQLRIIFTLPVSKMEISRIDWDSYEFVPSNDIRVPFEKGIYIYKISAEFDRGWVVYYFKIIVE